MPHHLFGEAPESIVATSLPIDPCPAGVTTACQRKDSVDTLSPRLVAQRLISLTG